MIKILFILIGVPLLLILDYKFYKWYITLPDGRYDD